MTVAIQPLNPYNKFVDENGKLSRDGYSFLYNLYLRVGGSLDSLNAATLLDATWSEPNAIGNTTPSTGKFTTLEGTTSITTPTIHVTSSVDNNSGGIKHARLTTGSVAAGATALVTLTWSSAFADANYTVTVSLVEATAAVLSLHIIHIESVSASQVKIRVENTSAGALTGTLNVIALHD